MASLAPTSDALKDLASQIRKNSDARVQTFESRTFDVANEKMGDARYIGDFRPNQNRLNVFSMISKDDADDYYRFQMKSPGKLHLALLADQLDKQRKVTAYELPDALHVQLIQVRGPVQKVVADSDPRAGAAYHAYQQLSGEGLALRADKYVVHVSRSADTPQDREYLYSLQLVGDRYYQDYDTLDHEAQPRKIGMNRIQVLSRDAVVSLLGGNALFGAASAMSNVALAARSLSLGADSGQDPAVTMLGQFVDELA